MPAVAHHQACVLRSPQLFYPAASSLAPDLNWLNSWGPCTLMWVRDTEFYVEHMSHKV